MQPQPQPAAPTVLKKPAPAGMRVKPLITVEKPVETPTKQDTTTKDSLQEKAGALISSNNAAAAAHAIADQASKKGTGETPAADSVQYYERLMAA